MLGAVGANFTDSDPPQALLDVRAKAILREATAVLGQFDVSPLDVARHLEAEAVCDDIRAFLNDVVSLA